MRETFGKILRILNSEEKKTFTWLTALTVLSAVLEMFSLTLVVPATSILVDSEGFLPNSSFTASFNALSTNHRVVIGMSVMVFVFFLKNIFNAAVKAKQFAFQSQIEIRISNELLRKYLKQPYAFHVQTNSSEMYRNLIDIAQLIETTIAPSLLLICESLVIIGLIILLLIVEPSGFLAVLVVFGLFTFLFTRLSNKSAQRHGQIRRDALGRKLRVLQDCFNGIKEIRISGREQIFLEQFGVENTRYATSSSRFLYLKQLPAYFLEIIVIGALGLLVIVLAIRGSSPTDSITILAIFGAAAFRVLPSLNRVITAFQNLRFGSATLDSVIEGIEVVEVRDLSSHTEMAFEKQIAFLNVGFSYGPDSDEAIRDVNFTIEKGSNVGIIGKSGAGKSTIIDLLLGLNSATSGKIKVDGFDIATCLSAWRKNIGYVPQNVYISDSTIKENIAFGVPMDDIDESKLVSAIEMAQLEIFISNLADGVNSRVGENGLQISGGERQRIGIARALYSNPQVLILDEPTSSLDAETEAELLLQIENLNRMMTVIMVTHRVKNVENCDKVLLISDGRIAAMGNYAEVISLIPKSLDDLA
jgi:ABC-type multidrug transport system fused ATPase/permease subunit